MTGWINYHLKSVTSSHHPDEIYDYQEGHKNRIHFVNKKSTTKGCLFEADYYFPGKNNLPDGSKVEISGKNDTACDRVKTIKTPSGPNEELHYTHIFKYNLGKKDPKTGIFSEPGFTHVIDANQHELVYHHDCTFDSLPSNTKIVKKV